MELWGMEGLVLLVFAIGIVFIGNYFVKKPFLKFLSKPLLLVIGLGLVAYAGSTCAWWGLSVPEAGPSEDGEVTPGATFEVEVSEANEYLTYDKASKLVTLAFYENLAAEQAYPVEDNAGEAAIPAVDFTITLYRTDYIAGDNAVTKITTTIPTFHGKDENESITYSPIAKTSDGEDYNITLTPSGGSARYEYTYLTVGPGASKAVSVSVTLSNVGCCQFDNFDSRDVIFHTAGGDVRFRVVKTGEYTA